MAEKFKTKLIFWVKWPTKTLNWGTGSIMGYSQEFGPLNTPKKGQNGLNFNTSQKIKKKNEPNSFSWFTFLLGT